MRRIPALTLLGALLCTLMSARATSATTISAQIPGVPLQGGNQPAYVRTDGTNVAWTQDHDPSRFQRFTNLYVASTINPQPRLIAEKLSFGDYRAPFQPGFDLDDNQLAYIDRGENGTGQLLVRDLRFDVTRVITSTDPAEPAIARDTVVWWEGLLSGDTTPYTLKARSLYGAQPRVLAEFPASKSYLIQNTRMSERWVVWAYGSYDNGEQNAPCWAVFAVPTGGGSPRRIDSMGCGSYTLTIDDDTVAYTNAAQQLVVRNLQDGSVSASGPHSITELAFDGHFAFWSKGDQQQIWGYDPRNNSAFPVASTAPISGRLHVDNNTVAWFTGSSSAPFAINISRIYEVLPTSQRIQGDPDLAGRDYYPETHHTLGGAFRSFWQRNGGLSVFGFPMTEEFVQGSRDITGQSFTVQFLERQRYELHPENAGTPYEVLLGRLGAEALADQGRPWQTLPRGNSSATHYFAETGHAIAPQFWDYWRSHGLELGDRGVSEREALALFGMPISEPQMETNSSGDTVLTQWFERARFEYHPNNPAQYRVLLGRLAADRLQMYGW